MENGKKPINPLQNFGLSKDEQIMEYQILSGLTKREYFAAMAMQGLLANSSIIDLHREDAIEWVSRHSILQADSLLNALK